MDIKGKKAIVTGASSGLGAAITEALIINGATVYGIARNEAKLNEMKHKYGDAFVSVQLDITNAENVKAWVQNTFSENYSPDILINNAGAGIFGKIDEMSPTAWTTMINTNLNGMYFLTSEVAALIKNTEDSAHIINIGSILGSTGRAESAGYCATKYGIQGFSDALFLELRPFNIKVTCFNPGSIATHFFESSGISSHSNMLQPKDLAISLVHILQTPDNMLISDITIRPLNPKSPN